MMWCEFGVTFDFAKMFSVAIFETYSFHKNISIAATDYKMFLIKQPVRDAYLVSPKFD